MKTARRLQRGYLLDPYRFGGPAAGAPTNYPGLTLWINGTDPGLLYQTSGGSLVTTDAQSVDVAQSGGGLARCMRQSTSGARPLYKTGIVNGKSVLRFDGTDDFMTGNATSTPGTGGSSLALSDFISASAYTYVAYLSVTSARAAQALVYNNDALWAEQGGFAGLMASLSGATVTFHAYNWDGNADSAVVTGAQSTFHKVAVRHDGGNIRIRINGSAWVSTASGNTSTLTQPTFNGHGLNAGDQPAFDLAQEAWWNVALTDAEITAIENYMAT